MTEDTDKFEHRARGGVDANTFKITAIRHFVAQEPSGKDYKNEDYYLSAVTYETDEHPGWVFGVGGDETSFAYEKSDPKGTLDYQYGWSNWGPYWAPDPYVYEKMPVLFDPDNTVTWLKDTWDVPSDDPEHPENNMFAEHQDPKTYYSVAEDLLDPVIEDIKVLDELIGRPMDDKSTWEHDDD